VGRLVSNNNLAVREDRGSALDEWETR